MHQSCPTVQGLTVRNRVFQHDHQNRPNILYKMYYRNLKPGYHCMLQWRFLIEIADIHLFTACTEFLI